MCGLRLGAPSLRWGEKGRIKFSSISRRGKNCGKVKKAVAALGFARPHPLWTEFVFFHGALTERVAEELFPLSFLHISPKLSGNVEGGRARFFLRPHRGRFWWRI